MLSIFDVDVVDECDKFILVILVLIFF